MSARSDGSRRDDGSTYPSGRFSGAATSGKTGECAHEERFTNLLVSIEPACATLTWTPPSGDRDTGYKVERCTYGGQPGQRVTLVEEDSRVGNRYQDCSAEYKTEGARHSLYLGIGMGQSFP